MQKIENKKFKKATKKKSDNKQFKNTTIRMNE